MASAVSTYAHLGAFRSGSPPDLPRRAHTLLAERFPAHRVKHKPLSILRQEGRRALEQFLDAQTPPLPKPDRDKLIEEVLGEAAGFGPLEELFRDEAVKEIMLLAAAQVIAKKDAGWVPTSVRFRDPAHLRGYVRRLAETGEPLGSGAAASDGAFDVLLANGYRVIGILPPEVLDQPPLAAFVRGQPAPTPAVAGGGSGSYPPLSQAGSSVVNVPLNRVPVLPNTGSVATGVAALTRPVPPPVPAAPVSDFNPPTGPDPWERLRRKVSERIIGKCAAAGVYDLSAIPAAELQRVVLAHVEELNGEEGRKLTDQEVQFLALEILTGMRR